MTWIRALDSSRKWDSRLVSGLNWPRWARLFAISPLWGLSVGTSSSAFAEGVAPPWVGVWRGTIGTATVQVCLQHRDYGDEGAYYYMRHLAIISLGGLDRKAGRPAPGGAGPVWTEAPFSDKAAKGPVWHVTSVNGGQLRGVWSDGAKSLPIVLTSVPMAPAGDEDEAAQPCGNKAFSLPRFTPPVITTKPGRLMGGAYTRVLINPGKQFANSSSETFQLPGDAPAIRRVNADLYRVVPTGPQDAAYFTCSMAALAQNGLDGDASSALTPIVLTRNFLVVQDSESDDCGGAHPNSSVTFTTWDLRTGTKVNLYDWFTKLALTQTTNDAGSKDAYVTVAFTPAFRKLIDQAFPRGDPDCVDAEHGADDWEPHLTPKGVAFTPQFSHAEMACTEDAVIPFASLAPYLGPAGKTRILDFRAEIAAVK
jgi:hypothetical protein